LLGPLVHRFWDLIVKNDLLKI